MCIRDSRYRQSLLGDATKHLKHQESVYRHQIAILRDVQALALNGDSDMRRVHIYIRQRLAQVNDPHALQGLYDAFERSYIEHNKVVNQEGIEKLLTGAGKYLGLVVAAIKEDLEVDQPELALSTQDQLVGQLEKLQRDVHNVKNGLSLKAKQ